MKSLPLRFPMGPGRLLLEWPPEISAQTTQIIQQLFQFLQCQSKIFFLNLTPAYHSLGLHWQSNQHPLEEVEQLIATWLQTHKEGPTKTRKVSLPVCYDSDFGPDLAALETTLQLSREEIIQIHTAKEYQVYMLGFLPGFPYMGEIALGIQVPRIATPRPQVPQGAVGIAGPQTGIYPSASPGGWNLIGNCPLPLFSPQETPCTLLQAGDQVSFFAISPQEHQALQKRPAPYNLLWKEFCDEF